MAAAAESMRFEDAIKAMGIHVQYEDETVGAELDELAEAYGLSDYVETTQVDMLYRDAPFEATTAGNGVKRSTAELEEFLYLTANRLGTKTGEELRESYMRDMDIEPDDLR